MGFNGTGFEIFFGSRLVEPNDHTCAGHISGAGLFISDEAVRDMLQARRGQEANLQRGRNIQPSPR